VCAGADDATLAGFSKPRKPSIAEDTAAKQLPDGAPESGSDRRGSQGSDEAQPGEQKEAPQTQREHHHSYSADRRQGSIDEAASTGDAPIPNGHVPGGAEMAALASKFHSDNRPAALPPPGTAAGDVAASGQLADREQDGDNAKEFPSALCNGKPGLGSQTGSAEARTPKCGLERPGSMPADDPNTDATPEAVSEAGRDPEAANGNPVEMKRGRGVEGEGVDAVVSTVDAVEG